MARSVIANAQRCVNLYPEKNTEDSPFPFTHYPRAGSLALALPPVLGRGRGIYLATNDVVYCVVGQGFYKLNPDYSFAQLGTISAGFSMVSMQDNGLVLVLVDGTPVGYQLDLTTEVFSQIVDPAFYGADKVDYLDTFTIFNKPKTKFFYSTLSNTIAPFDPLYFAGKVGYPDKLQTLAVMHKEIWLFGTQKTTEVWYNSGGPQFPFEALPGAFIEHGCVAKYSVAKHGLMLFWLARDKDGRGIILKGENYTATRLSTPAIEAEIGKYALTSDAIGFCYQQLGHVYYVLTFPTADKTWVVDIGNGLWHEETWTDQQGAEHRIRASCSCFGMDKNLALDWENGTLFSFEPGVYEDLGQPIVFRRGFPHLVQKGDRQSYNSFVADVQGGEGEDNDPGPIYLRWSDTRGRTWGSPVAQEFAIQGNYLAQPQWQRLGLARDRVFEVFWSGNLFTALNGGYVDASPSGS